MRLLNAIIHNSVVSVIDLRGLALDAGRPGRLIAHEEIKGGDAVQAIINEPSVPQEVTTKDHSVGCASPLVPFEHLRGEGCSRTNQAEIG